MMLNLEIIWEDFISPVVSKIITIRVYLQTANTNVCL